MAGNWQMWCRLCANDDIQNNMDVVVKSMNESKLTGVGYIAMAISKIFWVNITPGEGLPEMICSECLTLIKTLVELSKHVSKVQKMYGQLLSTPQLNEMDVREVRNKFFVLGNEQDSLLPDVHHLEDGELQMNGQRQSRLEEDPLVACVQKEKETNVEEVAEDTASEKGSLLKSSEEKRLTKCVSSKDKPKKIERKLLCTKCDKTFGTRVGLQRHMQCHVAITQRKMYPCETCDMKFVSNSYLWQHVRHVHQNVRPLPIICEQCGTGVLSNAALKDHMLVHTEYAPHECDICQKCFKSERCLRQHKETHDSRPTPNRPIRTDQMQQKCDYCGREFKRDNALKCHLILHTGQKPYSCDFCNRTFASGSNCCRHKKRVHPVELAAQKAAGAARTYSRDLPKLEDLKAFIRNKENLLPMAPKQSACLAANRNPNKPAVVSEAAPQ
ncbi:zinc finger protein 493-like [Scaptodrosophila lebanonensis]|uniref:Zinc finger protein 493-like n=1 Tax=Drosophila lebanonensis TaxID=7225 RepID=A0A6J2TQE2_DROLE|nr:zinc finger protein 493-like [Scaptodrosophila lebanonensis]